MVASSANLLDDDSIGIEGYVYQFSGSSGGGGKMQTIGGFPPAVDILMSNFTTTIVIIEYWWEDMGKKNEPIFLIQNIHTMNEILCFGLT